MAQFGYTNNEIFTDPMQSKETKHKLRVHNNSNQEFSVLIGSDGDSDSEEIEILELRKRMWKDQMLLNKLEVTSKEAAAQNKQYTTTCQCLLVRQPRPSRKTELRAEDGVLHYMLKVMRDCDARGFVYGILPNTGPPITGSSDSLRAWWKDTVLFDRNAPPALVNPETILPIVEQSQVSYIYKLQDMNDNTIGSILSALIQHCEPPQRSCPLEQGLAPPWWPTGEETWWGLQGQVHAQLGPPPYRKPHDLRKGWKLSLLAAVIKHMSLRFNDMRSLVWQSKGLQHKMSVKDVDTWSRVLKQEEALVEQTKNSLVIIPLDSGGGRGGGSGEDADYVDDGMTDTRKRKWGFGNENCWEENFVYEDLCPNVELDPMHRKLEGTSKMAPEQSMQCTNHYQYYVRDGGGSRSDGADYVGDDNTNTGTRKLLRFENGEERSEQGLVSGDLWLSPELELYSINELMRFMPQESSGADLSSLI